MKYGNLILEKKDFVKLKKMFNFHRHYEDDVHKDALDRLKERVDAALVLDEINVPDDVVRLNSKVTVEDHNGLSQTFLLVAPAERDLREGNLSILSNLGASIIGLAEGDSTKMGETLANVRLRLVKVHQTHSLSPGTHSETELW
jgi:regulator of nucleoside diphosphate kinase